MKRAFTLIELLVVIGIMGMLATVSIGGYSALTRGMAERGALDAARGIAETALQRAQIDRSRTYLFLFTEVVRADSDDEAGVACGVAIAVRPIGRFSRVSGSRLYDEFGDLNQSHSSLEQESEEESESEQQQGASTIRIYKLKRGDVGFAEVREGVFCSSGETANDLEEGQNGMDRDIKAFGFEWVSGKTFAVGDEYGQEFAVMRLPPGFTFTKNVQMSSSSDLGMKQVDVKAIEASHTSAQDLEVFSRGPDGEFRSVGFTSETKDYKRN